jgi:predicted XRE-type DNA-binding protein
MFKKRAGEVTATPSSGNVFADLGFAEPEEELTKAQLASQIRPTIKRRRLAQAAAAKVMGIDQPKEWHEVILLLQGNAVFRRLTHKRL